MYALLLSTPVKVVLLTISQIILQHIGTTSGQSARPHRYHRLLNKISSLWHIQQFKILNALSWSCKSQGLYGLHPTGLPATLENCLPGRYYYSIFFFHPQPWFPASDCDFRQFGEWFALFLWSNHRKKHCGRNRIDHGLSPVISGIQPHSGELCSAQAPMMDSLLPTMEL